LYLPAASGRDLLLGKKGACAASPGLDFLYDQQAVSGILEIENIFQLAVLRLFSEIMGQGFELNLRLPIA
jgi:hypothetical protein